MLLMILNYRLKHSPAIELGGATQDYVTLGVAVTLAIQLIWHLRCSVTVEKYDRGLRIIKKCLFALTKLFSHY